LLREDFTGPRATISSSVFFPLFLFFPFFFFFFPQGYGADGQVGYGAMWMVRAGSGPAASTLFFPLLPPPSSSPLFLFFVSRKKYAKFFSGPGDWSTIRWLTGTVVASFGSSLPPPFSPFFLFPRVPKEMKQSANCILRQEAQCFLLLFLPPSLLSPVFPLLFFFSRLEEMWRSQLVGGEGPLYGCGAFPPSLPSPPSPLFFPFPPFFSFSFFSAFG